MGYLISADYNRLIQDVSLQQIISGKPKLIEQGEVAAISEAKSYLVQKYDVDSEFTNTAVYSHTVQYKSADRVYLDAPYYSDKQTYILNQLTLKAGFVYVNITPITVAEPFNETKWTKLGAQYDIFYANYPYPVFSLTKVYAVDDFVFWKDKNYKALIATQGIDHDTAIQFNDINTIPYINIFPDNTVSGYKYWHDEADYVVPPGSLLNTNYFTLGDNRNQQLVMYIMDIVIYNLYRRIPPAIVPEVRIMAYQYAISWLKNVAKGNEIVADITKLQPMQGGQIRWGSRVKNNNYY